MELDEIRHPLHTPWTLFVSSPSSTKIRASNHSEWENQTKEVYTFDSIEYFWRMWNNVPPGTELLFGSDYFLFRKGIQPSWEVPENIGGGRFLIRFARNNDQDNRKAEKYWLWTALALIGETITHSEYINGANFSLRRQGIKIAIWVKACPSEEILHSIGLDIRSVLGASPDAKLPYEVHGVTQTVFSV